ncbi:cyclopropane-fatty-acyl-phospholipid synthase family protein [Patulibacter brassicae]|jgi:cyclopropane-fatty-acyl-phospholipid synthase|uniref:Cyclopropane-fatty-acyl-phospholipid synthase family protein n=1 Tax=Patulibacter brassicae TaxID=1705717 RepID=A0ABU4VKQ4_9ACTN|nr:cyclopropane-fatty-acyl-phospholipid synthase family protein [Patulibacter brassicae]MDX8152410.1 cyclopropane-fatty-acyl-phospholipid synthase family protein [Patulibacter brassicae]
MSSTARRYAALDLALERGLLPDALLRAGSRWGAGRRLRREERGGVAVQDDRRQALIERMSSGPIAERPESANEQHYELPAEFLGLILGPRRKYSGCLWSDGVTDLAGAEDAMLDLTVRRAGLRDGMELLDLGCGWGSLSLYVAERFPACRILAVSNSHGQREHLERERDARGIDPARLRVVTQDINDFDTDRRFDRVISIEMLEHLRNWHELLRRVAGWLRPDGRCFVHVFSHRRIAYRFVGTWAAERFFTEGTMPSHDLLERFADDLVVERRWAVDGTHYARTLEAWLARLDAHRDEALALLEAHGGRRAARRLLGGWRLFLLSTEQIWGRSGGQEWLVSHYLLRPRSTD